MPRAELSTSVDLAGIINNITDHQVLWHHSPAKTTNSESSCLGIPRYFSPPYKDKANLQHCSVNCEDFSRTIPARLNIKDLKVNCSLCSQKNGPRDILCSLYTSQTDGEHILYTQSFVCASEITVLSCKSLLAWCSCYRPDQTLHSSLCCLTELRPKVSTTI